MNTFANIATRKNILIVDDEEEIREILASYFDQDPYITFQAKNGEDALALCQKTKMDVIISDIKMPIMDGIQMAEELRKRDPSTPVIFVTAFDDTPIILSALRAGAFEFITKPFKKEFIINRVNKALQYSLYNKLQDKLMGILHEVLGIESEDDVINLGFEERLDYLQELVTVLTIRMERQKR